MFKSLNRKLRRFWAVVLLSISTNILCDVAQCAETEKEIVLIGSPQRRATGEHDFPGVLTLLQQFLAASPDAHHVRTVADLDGWPAEGSALDGASTIVLYFEGVDSHPFLNAAHRSVFESLMKRGVGVVALHQASTVPTDDTTVNLERFLGGARHGMFDRADETVQFRPVIHPIWNGVGEFFLTDEFYPTIRFLEDRAAITPILTGQLHPNYRTGAALVIDKPEKHIVGWAFERSDGGRAFTFTGLHYILGLDNPALRTLLLNAIFWTAKMDVPLGGVRTMTPDNAAQAFRDKEVEDATPSKKTITTAIVTPARSNKVIEYPWGRLTWYVSRELRNSDTMTTGEAVIKPHQQNPRHFHPNCDEVLHVLKGRIIQTMGDESLEMNEGDTVNIPAGVHHSAKNIGREDAILSLSYSSADRVVVGE
jgi:mannose-6-phosphate isomerase-like protein (cupin superfamily)